MSKKETSAFEAFEKWIDPVYLTEKQKKIQTPLEAFALIFERTRCGDCDTCGIRMYEKKKGQGCQEVISDALLFLKKYAKDNGLAIPDDDFYHYHRLSGEAFFRLIGHYYTHKNPAPENPAPETTPEEKSVKCCSSCTHFSWVGGVPGIPFCDRWHNFTRENEYCTRYSENATETP